MDSSVTEITIKRVGNGWIISDCRESRMLRDSDPAAKPASVAPTVDALSKLVRRWGAGQR